MKISYEESKCLFHLQNKNFSYIMQVVQGQLCHIYWGNSVQSYRGGAALQYMDRSFSPNPEADDRTFSLDVLPLEYPAYGAGDFRTPAYQTRRENGTTVSGLKYVSHRIFAGKPALEGLPATYVEDGKEAMTLEIDLQDAVSGLHATLAYTIFRDYSALARSVRFRNTGNEPVSLLRALSASIDLRDDDYDLLTLYGGHANETNIARRPVQPGMQSIESRRGASSHQHNPFFALLRKNSSEDAGDVFGFSLVYSGSFLAQIEREQFGTVRASIGINPFDFSWQLEPGESFQTPEAVMVYSREGLNGMSAVYNGLYRTRLARGTFRDRERPILINNWEATYFDFDAAKITEIAATARGLGIELFVLDDGWFGHRDDDKSSLGDWVVDKRKLPDGLDSLAKAITASGMQFGLWFEPEMVSPDSELYRRHPDWCLHVPDYPQSYGRSQLVLDLSREDVRQYIIDSVSAVLSSAPITYVKWDMNRHMTEVGSAALPAARQRETAHRYMLGLYRVLEEITSAFPHILFESCSGGGGRYDPGMLHYMPQTWTSDNTDAVSRLKIQYGTSLVYPASSMGAHVSTVPNHQVGRITPLSMRGHAAMSGNFGYELDLTQLTDEEKITVREQIALYKQIRPLVQFGRFHRILSPFEGNETAWIFVSGDLAKAVLAYFRVLSQPAAPVRILKCKGLNPKLTYYCPETGGRYGGDELMNIGLTLPPLHGDFTSLFWTFSALDK